jgi:tetratricopeptide (TPR) repeat protein
VNRRRFADAITHFARARELVPDDPGVLFGEACLEETHAAPRMQNYYNSTTLPNGFAILGVASPSTHWRRAENLLRRAIAIDPAFAEASLHLGRISVQQQKYDEGIALLGQAAEHLEEPQLTYFARLFAGDALQAAGRTSDARESFELAIALFPDSQAARLALGSLQRTVGDRAAALDIILPTLTKPPSSRRGDDPWWAYYDGDAARWRPCSRR